MSAAVIERPAAGFNEAEIEIIRRALSRLDDHDRRIMWQCLDLLDRVFVSGDVDRVDSAISLAPYSVQPTLAAVAARRLTAYGARVPTELPEPDTRFHYEAPKYRHLAGRATNADCWTASWVWTSFAPEALAQVACHRVYAHDPVPLLWGHSGQPLGFTEEWRLGENGDLDVEAWLLPTARAQLAAGYVKQDLIGMSIGTKSRRATWSHYGPAEWEPREGRLDLEREHEIEVTEVSLTTAPAQPDCRVRHVW